MLRPMIRTDLAGLWPIFKAVCGAGLTLVQDETTTAEAFEAYWTDRGGEQWTAVVEERVVGGFTLRSNHPGRGAHVGTATYIVAEHARSQGVGTELALRSLDRAHALGFTAIQFNFVVSTNEGALRLWRKLGFEIVGTLPRAFRHPQGAFVDAYVMHRNIHPKECQ